MGGLGECELDLVGGDAVVGEVEEAGGLEGVGDLVSYLEAGGGVAIQEGAKVDELARLAPR